MSTPRTLAFESADTVNRVVALLVHFPELHSVRSNPDDGTLTLSFAVRKRLDRRRPRFRRAHRRARPGAARSARRVTRPDRGQRRARCRGDLRHRDPGRRVVLARANWNCWSRCSSTRSATGSSVTTRRATPADDDPAARDDLVEVALDALRDPAQRQRLVGFREEQRVLVYFAHAPKRAKARARS